MGRLIIIGLLLFLALILAIGQVFPKYQELKILEKEAEQKRAEIQGKEEYFQGLKKLDQELKDYQEQLSKINSALPAHPSLEILLNFLQKTSSQSGLVLKDIKPPVTRPIAKEEGKEESEIKETELSFVVSGDYPSFKNFLSVLERSARLIEVESIFFSLPEKEGSRNFDLKIKIYSY